MEKIDFISELEKLVNTEDLLAVGREINELKSKFEDFCIEQERLKQVEVLEAQERGENVQLDSFPNPLKDDFYSIYNGYRERKIALSTAKKLEEEANLRLKKNLIEKLRLLISEEENIGVAINSYKDIQENWKIIGDIPRDKRQDIQAEYSKLLEFFFHNLKIYRELKDHDLKRNFQIKSEIVEKIKILQQNDSIKEVESAIKVLQNEFDETGPVPQEEWESLKAKYWESVKSIYDKIKQYYEGKREELKANIEKKKTLLEKVKMFIASIDNVNSIKAWEDLTKELLVFQEEWKLVGFGTKKENEELWKEFRQECDSFFNKKKEFFSTLKVEFDKNAELKRNLIKEISKIKDSTDWKTTTEKILKLQKDWKNIGSAGQKHENTLWKQFRTECDSFFNAKQKHFEEIEKEFDGNLQEKIKLVERIKMYEIGEDKKKALNDLKEFSQQFNAIGKVPIKDKDKIYNEYKSALDEVYSKLKLEGTEREKAMFQVKVDTLKANPDAENLMDREKKNLRTQIQVLQQEAHQFENNLGFFANSKGADALKKEVMSKIDAAKMKIEDLKRKIKMLTSE
jgi:hypothetical protein